MSRLLKGLVCVAVAIVLAGTPMAASAAPVRERGVVALLEATWARVVVFVRGVVGAEKEGAAVPPQGIVVCSQDSCSPPLGAGVPDGGQQNVDIGPDSGSDG